MRPLYDCFKEEKSKADEMFEKLGYTITEEVISSERYTDGIQFMKQEGICLKKYIEFYYYHKQICIYAEQDIDGTIKRWESVIIDAKEIQAINQKCRELGWLDE